MCGICGILNPQSLTAEAMRTLTLDMATTLAHRGPDACGVFVDDGACVALGHRRLSIIDLSPLGHQPMASVSGRYQIVFNGEIYNFRALRTELEYQGHAFRSGSDTEVLVIAFEQWGLGALTRLNGMFALALWDVQERSLLLARDRLGKKPLYYGRADGGAVFGSELKALATHPDFDPALDLNALALYFRLGYIPTPYSIYRFARKLPPAHFLLLLPGDDPLAAVPQPYWSLAEAFMRGRAEPFSGSEGEAVEALETLLRDAVGLRMMADVPLGAFLSGGVDSSLVTALMQEQNTRPVQTFCIGFGDPRYNEAPQACAVATYLGTQHMERILSPADLLAVVPELPHHYDEPFADASQVPTLLVCRLAREKVTVALSGDGGDELFNGYERHLFLAGIWNRVRHAPRLLRASARAAATLPDTVYGTLGGLGPKLRWRLEALGTRSFADLYRHMFSHFHDPVRIVHGATEQATAFDLDEALMERACGQDLFRRMSLMDHLLYLPDDILAKVDRASMAVGLETRCPLLDHRVVEFAATIPTAWKVRGGQGKALLRQVLHRHVPAALVDRPKMGFGVPIDLWLKNELRDWCESLLGESALRTDGVIDADVARRVWTEYLAGGTHLFAQVWELLMYRAWRQAWPGRG